MCLEKITKTFKDFSEFEAYKVMGKRTLNGEDVVVSGPFSRTVVKRGIWMKAQFEPEDKTESDAFGFCVFKSRLDAYTALRRLWNIEGPVEKVMCKGRVQIGRISFSYNDFLEAAYVEYIKFGS